MFAFTRQEQKFLLILSFTFVLGLAIKYYRQSNAEKRDVINWQQQRDAIFAEFKSVSESQAQQPSAQKPVTKESLTGKINLNRATSEELQLLPRIGPATARKIIEYREANGPFQTIHDLQKVKGIGPKTFAAFEHYITVD